MLSLPDVLEVPPATLVLITGVPGAGKSTFLRRLVAHHLFDLKKPIVTVSTKSPPDQFKRELQRADRIAARSLATAPLRFVDAYSGTVGLAARQEQTGWLEASCGDPTSIGIALGKAVRELGSEDPLLAVESLTPVYLLNDKTFIKFFQSTLLRYAAERRRVVTTIDEGVGKAEDLTALLAIAPAVLRMHIEGTQRVLEVVKYPGVQPGKLVVGSTEKRSQPMLCRSELVQDKNNLSAHWRTGVRPKLGDFIGLSWLQLVYVGGLLWDYKRFPRLIYEVSRDMIIRCIQVAMKEGTHADEAAAAKTEREQLSIHDPEVARFNYMSAGFGAEEKKLSLTKFELESSTKERHVVRKEESALCWNINLGTPLCFYDCGSLAGMISTLDDEGCQWQAYEEKCMAAGNPFCEIVLTPESNEQLDMYLDSCQSSRIDEVMRSLVGTITDVAMKGALPGGRPTLGIETYVGNFQESTSVPAISNERFMLAVRLAGANAGKKLAENFTEASIGEDAAKKNLVALFTTLKVGRLVLGDTLKLYENCESQGITMKNPTCFFTTGFLNGFFSTVSGSKLRDLQCVGAGNELCEWEFI